MVLSTLGNIVSLHFQGSRDPSLITNFTNVYNYIENR